MTKEEYEKIVESAEATDKGNSFVASCRKFLNEKGFLSAKQVNALKNVRKTRYYAAYEYDPDDYEMDYAVSFDPWDRKGFGIY